MYSVKPNLTYLWKQLNKFSENILLQENSIYAVYQKTKNTFEWYAYFHWMHSEIVVLKKRITLSSFVFKWMLCYEQVLQTKPWKQYFFMFDEKACKDEKNCSWTELCEFWCLTNVTDIITLSILFTVLASIKHGFIMGNYSK